MASRNFPQFRSASALDQEKVPSNTLKRHPKMELNKNDMLRLLSYLEGELQARDVAIAALKADKAKYLLYQAKYGRFGLSDPFLALQRDSDGNRDSAFDEESAKAIYDNQLMQLEKLISTQRKAQLKMREQLCCVEKRFHKVCAELEDEKRKHAQDTAQGDDVTYMLEKERERLKQELDFEKSGTKKAEKELKKVTTALEEERAAAAKHKQVAIMLIKERKQMVERLLAEKQRNNDSIDKDKMKVIAEGLVQETKKANQMEAAMEKQLSEFDIEREQWKNRLEQEMIRNEELSYEMDKLREQVDSLLKQVNAESGGPKSIEIKSSVTKGNVRETAVINPTRMGSPIKVTDRVGKSNTPPRVTLGGGKPDMTQSPGRDVTVPKTLNYSTVTSPESTVQKTIMRLTSPTSENQTVVSPQRVRQERSEVKQHISSPRSPSINLQDRGSPQSGPVNVSTGGTTVFTTPSGGKISFTVGPGTSVRKSSAGRGTPPPVPPNKPAYVPPGAGIQSNQLSPRHASPRSPSPGVPIPVKVETSRPVTSQGQAKFGITISKDKITVSGPDSPNPEATNQRPYTIAASQSGGTVTSSTTNQGTVVRNTSQQDDLGQHDSGPSSQNLTSNPEIFEPEMADLQQLLVTMVTGENHPSNIETPSTSHKPAPFPANTNATLVNKYTSCGDLDNLRRMILEEEIAVNIALEDGTTPVLTAAESGNEDCLIFLLDNGGDIKSTRSDNFSPLHAAAGEGHYGCLKILLDKIDQSDVDVSDRAGWTSLYWSASNGHLECCRLLLDYGAKLNACNNAGWTPCHAAIHAGHYKTLEFLLTYKMDQSEPLAKSCDLINKEDNDGWTITQLASIKESKEMLQCIMGNYSPDLERKDKWGRCTKDIASKQCKQLLEGLDKNEHCCTVVIDLDPNDTISTSTSQEASFSIANISITESTTWSELEGQLSDVIMEHLISTANGLKLKRPMKTEIENSNEGYALGLSLDSIKYYSIGMHRWSPGTPHEKTPFEIVANNETERIVVELFAWDDDCQDSLAYETLIPVQTLHNYLRLIEQYKCLVFYGPSGTGKSYLARRLAHCVQARERRLGKESNIHVITLHADFTGKDMVNVLIEKGCLFPNHLKMPTKRAPVLLFDELAKVNISEIFGDVLNGLEHRGPENSFQLKIDGKPEGLYYLLTNCYIIGTMDRSRSTGLELSIQQRFRWVHFRIDTEPMKNLLSRHLSRRLLSRFGGTLPPIEDGVYKAVEWVIGVWQRLNEGLGKLGLPELVFGPSVFMNCPIEVNKPKTIIRWLSLLWNHAIAPAVEEAVIKGSGSETGSKGQEKVAKTALYVLMQRAIVVGCPLTGQEKERYLSSFHGSNELDIQMRGLDKRKTNASVAPSGDQSNEADLSPEKIISTEPDPNVTQAEVE
ncbi:unnamed protein product [Owenia fusiformis]|uniref:Cortactin-binding protein 2 n=1 Tax=Owenia fusiformis TaxID=6347 RepID=A0A8S4NVQ1_OWEFU|nr:unnamed protein product [Owenia fusiformis]